MFENLFKNFFAKQRKSIPERIKETREEFSEKINYTHINHKIFYKNYIKEFSKIEDQNTVDAINVKLHYIQDLELNYMSLEQWAYLLATIYHETAHTMVPIREYGGDKYFNRRYGPHTRVGGVLGNVRSGDGARYCGRGDIQITGRRNYSVMSSKVGLDLVQHPELALDPAISIKIAVLGYKEGLFTGKGIGRYINKNKVDYSNARRVINGKDRAGLIKKYALKFEQILRHSSNMVAAKNSEK